MLKYLKLFPIHEVTKYLSCYDTSYSPCYHNTHFCFFYFSNSCAFMDWLLNTLQDCVLHFFSISTISTLILFVLTAMLITSKYQYNDDNYSSYLVGYYSNLMSQYNTNLPKVFVVAVIVILNMIKPDFFIPDLYYNPQYKFLPFSRPTRQQTLPNLHIQNLTHCLPPHLVLLSYTSSYR